ncbi:MAG: MotA/TolQ/ExbB proton channel family protein [Myxococcales bacterium]|nr:MotA/TolQ/ExbB proton channel family protein [Myxococcales bacterium]
MRASLGTLVALCALAAPLLAQADPLTEAYRKEFAFLEAEKRALEGRLAQIQKESKAEIAGLEGRIATTQRQVLALGVEAETLADRLRTVEREAELAGEGVEGVDGLVQQMARTFTPYGLDWPPKSLDAEPVPPPTPAPAAEGDAAGQPAGAPDADAARAAEAHAAAARAARRLKDGFARLGPLLAHRAEVRREKGHFFLADGRKVEGQLFHLGDVATYGVSDQGAGALTPAGAGRLKLDPVQGEATARALADGAPTRTMDVFLYENLEQNYEVKQARTPLQVVEAGGAIAWVIVGLGGLALLMMLGRVALLLLAGGSAGRLVRQAAPHVDAGAFEQAAAACAAGRGAASRVLASVAGRLADDRDTVERLVVEKMLEEEGRLDRFGTAVLVTAAVAPLLGLLGTVTGMISTFDVITEFGTGNPKLLSGGISEALITTELGLVVAIPALLAGNLLNGWAERLKSGIEQGALALMNRAQVGEAAPVEEA